MVGVAGGSGSASESSEKLLDKPGLWHASTACMQCLGGVGTIPGSAVSFGGGSTLVGLRLSKVLPFFPSSQVHTEERDETEPL